MRQFDKSVIHAALWATMISAGALAQTAPTQPSSAPASEQAGVGTIEDVVVTARKREETALQVPGSVTAIRQEDLLSRGATSLSDISAYVPGLNVGTSIGGNAIVLRGINTGIDAAAASGVIIDGAPIGSSSSFLLGGGGQFDLDPSDIQRVEVLRGPQGTLYGASTLGGLVSYVTRRPSLTDFGLTASTEIAGVDHGDLSHVVRAAAEAPIVTDEVALRVSGFDEFRGGFIDDRLIGKSNINSAERYGGRFDLLLQPTTDLTIDVWGAIQRTDRNAEDYIVTDGRGRPLDGDRRYDQYLYPSRSQNFRIVHWQADYDAGFADLTYVGTYQDEAGTIFTNYTHSPLVGTLSLVGSLGLAPKFPSPPVSGLNEDLTLNKTTHEIRLASTSEGPLTWLVGAYYTHEAAFLNEDVQGYTTAAALVSTLAPAVRIGLDSHYTEYAGFGNVSWAIMPDFIVTGGFRYGEDDQRYQQLASGSSLAGLNVILESVYGAAGALAPATIPAKSSDTVKTYLADAKYMFSDDAQAYFRFATGYRPGGPNVAALGTPPTFGPDKVKSYELGLKGETPDRRASLTLAAFYIDWTKIQVTATSGGISYFTNGRSATSQGVEATANWNPVAGLSLGAVLAFTNASLNNPIPSVGATEGDRLPETPDWAATATADYEWPLTDELQGVLGTVLRYVDKRNTTFVGDLAAPNIRLPSYVTLDVRAGVKAGRYEVAAFIRNLSDERAELAGRNDFGLNEVQVQRPRTIGIMASARY